MPHKPRMGTTRANGLAREWHSELPDWRPEKIGLSPRFVCVARAAVGGAYQVPAMAGASVIVRMSLRTPTKSLRWGPASAQTSARMAKVRSHGTAPEERLRTFLARQGLRFSVNVSSLPGSPDIVFAERKVAVFVHGCFWHGHPACRYASVPQNNRQMWLAKIAGNARRDRRVSATLRRAGWSVLTLWECQRSEEDLERFFRRLSSKLR